MPVQIVFDKDILCVERWVERLYHSRWTIQGFLLRYACPQRRRGFGFLPKLRKETEQMKRNNLLLSCVVVLLASCHQPAISVSLSTENESQNNVTQNNTIVEGQDKKQRITTIVQQLHSEQEGLGKDLNLRDMQSHLIGNHRKKKSIIR